jgi:catechol 2,3-dioxygenase-like lactoylglutathione lyase family enzyme
MATDTATVAVKFHISLNVADLDRSVAFYRLLFNREAAKCRPDYSKFESDDPPLVLSLEPNPRSPGGSLNHLGFRVGDSAALVEIQRRFEAAGISTQREEGVECCYALQTKFWLTDPDRNLWELYVLHEDLDHRGIGQTLDRMLPAGAELPVEAPRPPVVWEHTLGMPFTGRLPQADASVDEVRLLGTFNAALPEQAGEQLLAEARRVLRAEGKLMAHTLVADRAFPGATPKLPGPAVRVEAIPVDQQLFAMIEQAGFVGLRLEKFAAQPCFVIEGVQMRESKVWAQKPARAPSGGQHAVIYKGPHKQIGDELGNTYPRGQRVTVSTAAVAALLASPVAEQFVVLPDDPIVALACGK